MPKPDPLDTKPAVHELNLQMTVQGQEFRLSGVFHLADGLAAFDRWVRALSGNTGGLTPEQVADLMARAETLAKRLEGLDDATPNS